MAKATYTKRGGTVEMNQLFATTLDKVQDYVEEQIFKDRPALAVCMENKDEKMFAGSEQARGSIITGKNPNGGWINENDGLSMDDYDPFEQYLYYPKHAGYGVRWSKEQQRVNRGSGKIMSLIDEKIENTVESLRDTINEGLWGSGGGDQMNGLQNMIPATVPASQTTSFGGINPSTTSEWRTKAINMTGLSSISDLEDNMLQMWNDIYVDKGKVDYIFTDQTTHQTYEKNARDFIYTSEVKIADTNFELCQYKRKPLIFDNEAPSGEMRFIDRRHFKMAIDPEYWFAWTDWKEAVNLPFTKFKQVLCDLNLCTNARRRLGCIFNISE